MHFLYKSWRNRSDLEDFRLEVYETLLQAAKTGRPEQVKPFLFETARNLLVKRLQRECIVSIDAVADLDARSVVVPNVDGFAGISYRLPGVKVAIGYRADICFGGVDGGLGAEDRINHSFYGPFAVVSLVLVDSSARQIER